MITLSASTAIRRKMFAACLSVICTVPLAAPADAETHVDPRVDPMDACIEAFVTGNFPAEQPINVRKQHSVAPRDAGVRTVEIQLTARETRTGREVATARCTVDRSGVVIALDTKHSERTAIASADMKTARNR